jgi:ATP phosphoribosyltransferase
MIQKDPFRFLIPRGRLFEMLSRYLSVMGVVLHEPDRSGFCGWMVAVDSTIEFWARKPSMIPMLLAQDKATTLFHAGLTGEDMLLESGVECLEKMAILSFSSRSLQPTKWVLAGTVWEAASAHEGSSRLTPKKLPKEQERPIIIGCEWLHLAHRLLKQSSISHLQVELVSLHGNEESAVHSGLCEWVICPMETGESLDACGMDVKERLMESHPCILARHNLCAEQRAVLEGIVSVLEAADRAAQRAMVTFDIPCGKMVQIVFPEYVISPTHLPLLKDGWEAGEVCIKRADLITVLPSLKQAGARAIVVSDVQAYID